MTQAKELKGDRVLRDRRYLTMYDSIKPCVFLRNGETHPDAIILGFFEGKIAVIIPKLCKLLRNQQRK